MRSVQAAVLAWRGLRFRSAGSVATLVVATLAVAAATLGPLYSGTAQDSLVREGLADAEVYTTGLVADVGLVEQPASPATSVAAVDEAVEAARYDRFWGAASLTLVTSNRTVRLPGQLPLAANVSWRRGMCASIRIVAGRCPTDGADSAGGADGAGSADGQAGPQAMVSSRTARERRIRLGDRLRTDLGGRTPGRDSPVVVGFYDVTSARAPGWAYGSPDQAAPAGADLPEHLDEVLVDRVTVQQSQAGTRATAFRPLRPGVVHVGDLPELTRLLAPAPGPTDAGAGGVQVQVVSGTGQVLAAVDADRSLVRSSTTAVTVQVSALALFVLYLVIAATSEERSGEVALAKLRGMAAGATAMFALAEPVLVLVVAVPVGAAVAFAADTALAAGLTAGSQVQADGATVVAAVAALAGGLAACALAARRLLTTPVTGQLRRTGGRRAALGRSVAVDAAVVMLAGAGVYELRTGSADTLGLTAPGLLALAAGLLVVRVVPLAARAGVRRTRRSAHVAGFLAVRNLARRPAGARLVVLVAVAVALAVFGIDGFSVARTVRIDTARSAVGADRVVHVAASSPGALLAAVRGADPTGRQAMAVAQSSGGAAFPLLAVDTPRLAATTSWDPHWGGTSTAALVTGLHPPTVPPVTAQGFLALRVRVAATGPAADLRLSVDLLDSTGHRALVPLGRARPDADTALRAPLPTGCTRTPCRLVDLVVDRSAAEPAPDAGPVDPLNPPPPPDPGTSGTVTVEAFVDDRGPVPVVLPGGRPRWRYRPSALDVFDPSRTPDVAVTNGPAGSIVVRLQPASASSFTIETTDLPAQLPVLTGRDTVAEPFVGRTGTVFAADLAGQSLVVAPLPGRGTLPRLGTAGDLIDLESLVLTHPRASSIVDLQVWLAPGAPAPALMARLAAAGVSPVPLGGARVGGTESVAARIAALSRTGPAIGLRIYLLAAVAALLLAIGALLTASFVTARRRSYELAAVLALGGRRRTLVRAGRAEQLVLIVTGTGVGAAAGLVAVVLALPVLGAVTAGGPVRPSSIAWVPVVAVLVAVLGSAGLLAHLASRHVVALAGPDRLREVQG